MYLRTIHTDTDIPTLLQFIRDNALGVLLTAIPSEQYPLIQLSHIPWVLDIEDTSEIGKLRGHIARANPQSKNIMDTLKASSSQTLSEEVSILFNGPAHHYITPKWYVDTKPATGKVVPTWNYSAVQVYGTAKVYYDLKDPATSEYISKQVRDLSNQSETKIMGYTGQNGAEEPWTVEEAPERYVDLLSRSIIGIEVEITRLEGKFKMSQEDNEADKRGVIDGLNAVGSDVTKAVAQTVEARGALKATRSQ